MEDAYPAKYVGIRDVAVCLCPQEQKGQSYCLVLMSHSMDLHNYLFYLKQSRCTTPPCNDNKVYSLFYFILVWMIQDAEF